MLFSNDDIVDRIARQMAIKNLTVNGLAEETGISSSSLSRYLLKRYKFPLEHITPMAKALGVSEEYLLGLTKTLAHVDTVKIPVIGNIACGVPILAEENVSEYIAVPKELRKFGKNIAACRVKGDSMEPTLFDGDTIICDNKGYDGNDGVYTIIYKGNGFVKRLQRTKDGVKIISDNKFYEPMFESSESEDFTVIGKVRYVLHKM